MNYNSEKVKRKAATWAFQGKLKSLEALRRTKE